jgi:flagellar export protein FliJ
MPFRYRFQSLLKQKLYFFERAQLALAEARQAYQRVEAERDRCLEEIRSHNEIIETGREKGLPVLRYLTLMEYLAFLEQQLQTIEVQLQQAAREVEEKKNALLEREREVKMLETLEENDKRQYRYEKLQREQKQVDEVAVFQDLARRKESGDN